MLREEIRNNCCMGEEHLRTEDEEWRIRNEKKKDLFIRIKIIGVIKSKKSGD